MSSFVTKLIEDGMVFLGLEKFLFGNKSSSSCCCSSSSKMESTQREDSEPGLKALTAPAPHLNPCCVSRADILPSSSMVPSSSSLSTLSKLNKKKKIKRDFPPPIHFLTRTENSPCHMPWIMKRCYIDGRLVLREVPVKHHEYFEAERSGGRLVLRLMYVDDDQLHPKKNVGEEDVDRDNGPSISTTIALEENEERLKKNSKSDDDDHRVDEDVGSCTLSAASLMEEDGSEDNKASVDMSTASLEEDGSEDNKESVNMSTASLMEEDGSEDNKASVDMSTASLEEDGSEDNKASVDIVKDIIIPPSPRVSNIKDGSEDAKSDEGNGLDVKQKKEVEIPVMVRHRAIKKVLNETRIYSSSMPEGRMACLPKDFLRIGTPTIRPIYS